MEYYPATKTARKAFESSYQSLCIWRRTFVVLHMLPELGQLLTELEKLSDVLHPSAFELAFLPFLKS